MRTEAGTINERLYITVPASLLLWAAALFALSFTLNGEVDRPISGKDTVTVRLVTASSPAPAAPVEKPAPIPPLPTPKTAEKPLKTVKAPPKTPPKEKPPVTRAIKASAPARPEQHLSEAKSARNGAVVTYQPMPKIPDDLRQEAFATTAVARFHVAADNSATVELLTPSRNPRLNRLLMEALKTWKFTSATEGGRPVASTVTIRVHFAVE